MNSTKATGSDGIPTVLLRLCGDTLAPSLTLLFNRSLREGKFPESMKRACIRPLFKAGDPSQPNNYRPVSLLPVVSKILERIVHEQLSDFLESQDLLPMEQFGIRSHHSTSDALVLTVEQIQQAQVARLYTGVAFVDMSKAFDKVPHQTLVGPSKSAAYASSCGVPQGSVLGQLLLVVYVRDMPHMVRPYGVTPTQFADDISLRASAETPAIVAQRLSGAVQHLSDWLRQLGLILNETKTQILPIPPHRSPPFALRVTCNS